MHPPYYSRGPNDIVTVRCTSPAETAVSFPGRSTAGTVRTVQTITPIGVFLQRSTEEASKEASKIKRLDREPASLQTLRRKDHTPSEPGSTTFLAHFETSTLVINNKEQP